MTEDAGQQVEETKKVKWVENELMTQYLRNKVGQEQRRDQMMSGGDQNGKNVKRGDNTLKCMVHSAVILCETSPLFELASQVVLSLAGLVRSTSTENHAMHQTDAAHSPGGRTTFDPVEGSKP